MIDLCLLICFVLIMAFTQRLMTNSASQAGKLAVEGYRSNKRALSVFILGMSILCILTAMRGISVGNDTKAYHDIFALAISDPEVLLSSRYEIGFIALNMFFALFTDNAQWLLATCSVITYACFVFYMVRNSKDLPFAFILFFFFAFGGIMNTIRQYIAIGFLLVAYDRVVRRKTLRAYIWTALAILFHASAVVMLVMPMLPYIRFRKIWILIGLAATAILTFSNLLYEVCLLIAPEYAHYFGGQYDGSGFWAVTYQVLRNGAFFVISYMAVVATRNRQRIAVETSRAASVTKTNSLDLWIMFIAFAGIILGYQINLIDRVVGYFNTYFIGLVPNSLKLLSRSLRKFLIYTILVVLIAYSILTQLIRPNWNSIYPYSFCWE